MVEEKNGNGGITENEAAIYDRQIRLWGAEAQKRIRGANILLIGLNGFTAEVAKNIILAGVNQVKLLDHRVVTKEDSCSQFLIDRTALGTNRATASLARAQALNPMVEVTADESNIDEKPDTFFKQFHVVCASDCTITQLKRINDVCRQHQVKFFAGDVWGQFGFNFADVLVHNYVMEVTTSQPREEIDGGGDRGDNQKGFETIVKNVEKIDTFVPFENILDIEKLPKRSEDYHLLQILMNYREKHGKNPQPSERDSEDLKQEAQLIIEKYKLGDSINYLIEHDLYAQVSPVCAIVGGIMGQEIIKVVSKKDPPNDNLFLFNPTTMCGKVLKLGY